MNKLLKQLVLVLEEHNIQLNNLNVDDTIPGEINIDVNKEITIVDRRGSYALYTKDASLDKTFYSSLTEALDVVAGYFSRVKEGTILYSNYSESKYKVIKHGSKDLYNLLNVNSDKLIFLECESISHIEKLIKEGQFYAE